MDTKLLQAGQQIGVARRTRIPQASIHTIDKVTPTGQVVIGNKRFNNKGYSTNVDSLDDEYLITIEEAEAIIAENQKRQLNTQENRDLLKEIAKTATEQAFIVLKQHGYYSDIDGHWEVMESEINNLLIDYMKEHKPIKNQ